jgi:type II secretory pathway predicted ATPase ExeA
MPKTTITLSQSVATTLKVYTAQVKSSLHAQSQVVEEALIEFFKKRGFKIEI